MRGGSKLDHAHLAPRLFDREQKGAVRKPHRSETEGRKPQRIGRVAQREDGRHGQSGCSARGTDRHNRGNANQPVGLGEPSHGCDASLDPRNSPIEEEEGFPSVNPPRARIRAIGAHVLPDRGRRSRHHSRSFRFTRLLRFSGRGRQRRGLVGTPKYVYM